MSTYLKSFLIQANINVDSTLFPSRAVRLILPAAWGKVTYQVQVHTCNCIPDLGRLSAGCNKQQSGTLSFLHPHLQALKLYQTEFFLSAWQVPRFETRQQCDGRGETISLWTDSGRPLCLGSWPLHHDAGAATCFCYFVRSGCHYGVRWDCVEPLPVLS